MLMFVVGIFNDNQSDATISSAYIPQSNVLKSTNTWKQNSLFFYSLIVVSGCVCVLLRYLIKGKTFNLKDLRYLLICFGIFARNHLTRTEKCAFTTQFSAHVSFRFLYVFFLLLVLFVSFFCFRFHLSRVKITILSMFTYLFSVRPLLTTLSQMLHLIFFDQYIKLPAFLVILHFECLECARTL